MEGTAPVISRHRQLPTGPTRPGLLHPPRCDFIASLGGRVDPQPRGVGGARLGSWFAMNHVTCLQSASRESDALKTVSMTQVRVQANGLRNRPGSQQTPRQMSLVSASWCAYGLSTCSAPDTVGTLSKADREKHPGALGAPEEEGAVPGPA